jgi:hypothetical protein
LSFALLITPASCFVDLSWRGHGPLMVYESLEQALGLRPRMQGRVGQGLALTSFRVAGTQLRFPLASMPTLEVVLPCNGWVWFHPTWGEACPP